MASFLVWFGILVGAILLYVLLFGFQTFLVLEMHYGNLKFAAAWEVPVELPDVSISRAPGRNLSYLGCEFEVPWNDVDEQKTRLVGKWQVVAFHSGKWILFSRIPRKELVKAFLGDKLNAESLKKLRYLMSSDTLESHYAFYRAMLEITPHTITPFMPRREAVRALMLLLLKDIHIAANGDSDIFSIHTKDLRGFQYGDPQSRPRQIVDELFTDTGLLNFTFHQVIKGNGAGISQAEINRVIQTVRVVH